MQSDSGGRGALYFRIAGVTLRVRADLPFGPDTFQPKLRTFQVDGPGDDTIDIRHHFALPAEILERPGRAVHRNPPWTIHERDGSWVFVSASDEGPPMVYQAGVFSRDFGTAEIHHPNDTYFRTGGMNSLTLIPTDQIILSQIMARRRACFFHSSAVAFGDDGFLFTGHSEAGKSTMVKMLRGRAEILCDDRNIVRLGPGGLRVHGTWSHGEVPDVSPGSGRLRAICLLAKDSRNEAVPLGRREAYTHLLDVLVKPFTPPDWWAATLDLIGRAVAEVPCYTLHFDRSGRVADVLDALRNGRG